MQNKRTLLFFWKEISELLFVTQNLVLCKEVNGIWNQRPKCWLHQIWLKFHFESGSFVSENRLLVKKFWSCKTFWRIMQKSFWPMHHPSNQSSYFAIRLVVFSILRNEIINKRTLYCNLLFAVILMYHMTSTRAPKQVTPQSAHSAVLVFNDTPPLLK